MIYSAILSSKRAGKKMLAILVDPDKTTRNKLVRLVEEALQHKVDYFFVGGSLMISENFETCISTIKEICSIPVIIFPGSPLQVSGRADGILFISLISGRNPEALIGQHVIAAPYIKKTGLEVLPTGYILVDSGKPTTASYMSNSIPIPSDKPEIAVCTAMAGEMLGLKLIYLDSGSGGQHKVTNELISAVARHIGVPLIAGGGIRSGNDAYDAYTSGADMIVVGNALEENTSLISELSAAARKSSLIYNAIN